MRALTVLQPWCWAIAYAGKGVENRSRAFAYRGPLAVHAGLAWQWQGGLSRPLREAFAARVGGFHPSCSIEQGAFPEVFTTGAVIAVTELVDVHAGVGCCEPWGHVENLAAAAAHRPVYHLVLSGTRALEEPVACRGRQGLWRLPDAVAAAVAQQATLSSSGPSSSVGPGAGV